MAVQQRATHLDEKHLGRGLGVATLAVTLLLAACGESGKPLPWQAFYFPSSAVIAVSAPGGPCNSDIAITDEGPSAIDVTAHEVTDAPPGHGSCKSPMGSSLLRLSAPLGSRKIQASDGSSGQVFNLATRLHQPITANDGLPWGAHSVDSPSGDTWMLAYQDPSHTVAYLLTSTPDDHKHKVVAQSVRGYPMVTPCDATLCWRENGLLYSVSPVSGRADSQYLSIAQARSLAATLV